MRTLGRSPGYAAAAVATFTVAMAANAAVFGAVYAVLLKPLPIGEPGRLVVGWESSPSRNQPVVEVSFRTVEAWRSSTRAFEQVAAFGSSAWAMTLEDYGDPVRIATVAVTAAFFETLGARPFLGRFFGPEDDRPAPVRPLVLSHRLWRTRFAARQDVVGTRVATGDGPALVVGVAPAELDVPRGVDAWLPVAPVLAAVTGADGFRDIGVLFVLGRLRQGVSREAAAADLDRVARESAARGERRFGSAVHLTELLDYHLGPVRSALWWLWGAVAVLLLIACANIAALLLARGVRRRRDHAVRLALGASTTALWRADLLESVLICFAAGAAGLVSAHWLIAALVALAPDDVPRLAAASVNLPVVALTFGVSLVAALVSASAPLLQSKRLSLTAALSDGAHGPARTAATLRGLLAVQVALSVVLAVAAGLMLRSYANVGRLDLGFAPDQVATLEIDSGRAGAAHNEWVRELIERAEELPGVISAGAVHTRPLALGAIGSDSPVVLEGQPNTRQSSRLNPSLNYLSATPGYFTTLRIPLLQGRLFDARDRARAPAVAVVSESTARQLWPGQDPIGRRLSLLAFSAGEPAESWRTVIGVVADVRYRGLDDVRLDVYEPAAQSSATAGHLVVRSSHDERAVAAAVQAEARRMEPRTIVSGMTSMEAVIERATATWRLSVWMFGLFAAVATALVAVGLFSTVSLDTARRSTELALRLALGARVRNVVAAALARTGGSVLAGVVVGLAVSVAGSRAIASLLFDVGPTDPWTYAGVVAVVGAAAVAGCLLPVYRTTRIDPASVLRRP